ncbi:hypothetical protein DO021_02545 [Desulfobacter hydrogenophilus]|uniref:Uncharacterized protein n=1 Tax=Desulfobacter hydrogenophilus TaxID=2291 RepID=A0A328FHI0_9BACT|nr:hypothetical protein [Desulfobacter hydrogenophilus]NDY70570.1 hypothetical protein [Desulfobacter hydrogenophilus]QBH13941.1 hypothetical protein EYB58_14010 [Desulfobacter hydrogenophilus]RAM03646.1 hypothetical protein DO021_02545 [Desulfobacter hydrogenophilus]
MKASNDMIDKLFGVSWIECLSDVRNFFIVYWELFFRRVGTFFRRIGTAFLLTSQSVYGKIEYEKDGFVREKRRTKIETQKNSLHGSSYFSDSMVSLMSCNVTQSLKTFYDAIKVAAAA